MSRHPDRPSTSSPLGRTVVCTVARTAVLAAAATAVLAAGCSFVRPYSADGAAEVAMVRVTTDFGGSTFVNAIDLSPCPSGTSRTQLAAMTPLGLGLGGEVSPLKMVGTSPKKEELIRERVVAAGKPLVLHVHGNRPASIGVPGWQCGFGLTFLPQAGAQYEVAFKANPNTCTGGVLRLGANEAGAVTRTPEPSARLIRLRDPDDLCRS